MNISIINNYFQLIISTLFRKKIQIQKNHDKYILLIEIITLRQKSSPISHL